MSSTELLRLASIVLVLIGIYKLLHAKQAWLHAVALAALAVLLVDVSKWAPQFSKSVTSLVNELGLLGGMAG